MKNLTFFNEENIFIDKRQELTIPNVSFTKDSGLSWINESYILASYYVDSDSAVTSTYNMRMMSAMPSKPKFPINDPNIVDVGNGDLKKIVYNGEGDEQTVDLVDLPKIKYIPSGEIINRGEFVENPINPFPVMMLDDGSLYETNTVYGTINYSFYQYVISSDYSETCIIDKQIQSLIITVDEELNPKNSYRLSTFNPSTNAFITRNDERFIPEIVDSTHLSLTSEQITKINDLISANGSIILVLDKYIGDETIIESYRMMNSTFTIDGVYNIVQTLHLGIPGTYTVQLFGNYSNYCPDYEGKKPFDLSQIKYVYINDVRQPIVKEKYDVYVENDIIDVKIVLNGLRNMDNMFNYAYTLKSVDLTNVKDSSKITSMFNVFSDCYSLDNVIFGEHFDTSNVENMGGMFLYCQLLKHIDLTMFNTEKVQQFGLFLSWCESLKYVDVSNFNNFSAWEMDNFFNDCYKLEEVKLGDNFVTEVAEEIDDMFSECYKLKSIDISKFKCKNVRELSVSLSIFDSCETLTSIDLEPFSEITEVDSYSNLFSGCINLSEIKNLDKLNTTNVSYVSYMFNNCKSLTSIDLSSWDMSNMTDLSNMFENCVNLTELSFSNISKSYRNDSCFIGLPENGTVNCNLDYDFYNFLYGGGLPSGWTINVGSKEITSKLIIVKDSVEITSLTEGETITVNDVNGIYNSELGCWEFSYLAETLTSNVLYNNEIIGFINNSTNNVNYAFIGDNNLDYEKFDVVATYESTSLNKEYSILYNYYGDCLNKITALVIDGKQVLPSYKVKFDTVGIHKICFNFNSSEINNLSYMFCNSGTCYKTIKFNETFDSSNVTDMQYMFHGCSGLTSLDVSKLNTSKVTNLRNTFCGATYKLTELDLSEWKTSNVTNLWGCFQVSRLTTLDLSNWDVSNVTDMSSMFYNSLTLTTINCENWNTSKVKDMRNMFYNCRNINLQVSKWDVSNVTYMSSMFYDCYATTSLDLSKWDTSKVVYMSYMFWGLTGLTDLNISSFNTSNVRYMFSMFRYCNKLTDIDIKHFDTINVTNMTDMFRDCTSLTSVTMSGNVDKVSDCSNMFLNTKANGVFKYNCEYNYDKILGVLPSTWTSECIEETAV